MHEKGKEGLYKYEIKEGDEEVDFPDKVNTDKNTLLPEVDFSTFVFSLNSSALVQLGVLNNPISGKKSTDLVLAKHTIDTISMLKIKTKGNLTPEEYSMVSNILYDLKILYVNKHGT